MEFGSFVATQEFGDSDRSILGKGNVHYFRILRMCM